jgi:hypothetical protein
MAGRRSERLVGVLGATSLVGDCLLPLLEKEGWRVVAFSRQAERVGGGHYVWRQLDPDTAGGAFCGSGERIRHWLSLAPIGVLPDYFQRLEECGARRVVALSSTSRFTKTDSSVPEEIELVRELVEGENSLRAWAEKSGIEWVILRPTLIYGLGRDRNITEIARFIRRFKFFPIVGRAAGLRQPVFAGDVASACLAALTSTPATNRAYNISGGETLSYRDMVSKVFLALRLQPQFLSVPLVLFRMAVVCLRRLPRYRKWTGAMAERMNLDMDFDYVQASRDLHYSPRNFHLGPEDLPG